MFQKILFLEFWVAQVSKKRPGSVRVFKNMGTVGQILGRVWTRPSPSIQVTYQFINQSLGKALLSVTSYTYKL